MATKLRLPKGEITAQDAIRTKRLAEAMRAGDHLKVLGLVDDPIIEFNKCKFFPFSSHSV